MKKHMISLCKLTIVALAAFFITSTSVNGQFLDKAKKFINEKSSGSFSEDEAGNAIKQALNKGVQKGVDLLSQEDGYYGNPKIKIPFPEGAKEIESKLRAMGMGDKIDEVVLSLNRAAEDAAIKAKDIFIAAIKNMTMKDAVNIVKGDDDAATQYLKVNTSEELSIQFKPIIKESLEKVDATKYWKDVTTIYNKIPFVKKVNSDLAQYATDKAIDGVFIKIAEEEKEIRENPAARTTELLKKVYK